MKMGADLGEPFKINKGLRQDCCASPSPFKTYFGTALKQWERKCVKIVITVRDTDVYTLHYADDQTIMAQDRDNVNYMFQKLKDKYQKRGLEINMQKTKYICIGGNNEDLVFDDSSVIEACETYDYLGVKIYHSGECAKTLKDRVNKRRATTGILNSILWSGDIKRRNKKNIYIPIYNTIFKSIIIYGSKTWQMNVSEERKLMATKMEYLRRAPRKSRMEKTTNERIREIMNMLKTILNKIKS